MQSQSQFKLVAMGRCFPLFAVFVFLGCGSESPGSNSTPIPTVSGIDNMPPHISASKVTRETLNVGVATVVESEAPNGRYQVVFEDDGETGYFYALDTEKADNPIVDALHIYNVQNVTDRDRPSELQIVWSPDGMKAATFINSYPHAVYNFADGVGCCRTGFPPVADSSSTHEWDESQLDHFQASRGH